MVKKLATAVGLTALLLTFGTAVNAEDFPATPLQQGAPRDLPGENLVPGAQQAADLFNSVTQPILQPILAPGAQPAAADVPPTAAHRVHHHRVARRHLVPHHVAVRHVHHRVA